MSVLNPRLIAPAAAVADCIFSHLSLHNWQSLNLWNLCQPVSPQKMDNQPLPEWWIVVGGKGSVCAEAKGWVGGWGTFGVVKNGISRRSGSVTISIFATVKTKTKKTKS